MQRHASRLLAASSFVGLGLLLSPGGCSSSSSSKRTSGCAPGQSTECVSRTGCRGIQTCTDAGSFDECECLEGGAGKSGTGGQDGSAAGAGGSGASGGSVGSGGSAGTEGNAGSSGGASDAGDACVRTGAEDCLNGSDDDCNGFVDCADPACAGPVKCVIAAQGATPGTLAPVMGGCPKGYSPVTIRRGLDVPTECDGCSCVNPQARCESGVNGYGTHICPGQWDLLLYNVFSTSCEPLPADRNLHFYSVRGFATCTAQGTSTPRATTWAENRTFCVADRVGGGCAAGSRCVAAGATPECTITAGTGACASSHPNNNGGTWYTGVADGRSCSACSCSFGTATCAGGVIQAFSGAGCSGMSATLGSGAEGSSCGLAFTPVSGRVSATVSNGSCPVNTFIVSGTAVPTGPQAVCCR